jgi:hypothetical protein
MTNRSTNEEGISPFNKNVTSEFDPFRLRDELVSKFTSEWKEIASLKTFTDSIDIGSYQLTGDINNPIVTKYSLST